MEGTSIYKKSAAWYIATSATTKSLYNLREACNNELCRRVNAKLEQNKLFADGWAAFAIFMAGVTQAMMCRAVLRWSRGHAPYGNRPASGEHWTPEEIYNAYQMADGRRTCLGLQFSANPLAMTTYRYRNQRDFELLWNKTRTPELSFIDSIPF